MTVYQMMTTHIDSYTNTAIEIEAKSGNQCDGIRGMILGVKNVRDELTIESAECEC